TARSRSPVDAVWTERVERLGTLGVKTYIAALGGALLAKAADARVDSLTQDAGAGPHGYSLRRVAEFLAEHVNRHVIP
ncbi:MAG: restriction endonuclease, SacI family, partial [Acidimicrobiales bacterium]